VADDSAVPVVLRMLLQFVESRGLDKLGLYQTACKKADAVMTRINDTPEYWLEADDALARDDAAIIVAELVRLFFHEQPEPLLVESDGLADEVNRYGVGSAIPPGLAAEAAATVAGLSEQGQACLGALAWHASRVAGHGASNGTRTTDLAEVFSEPTGVRPELLSFLFGHPGELDLVEPPPPCSREQYFAAVKIVATRALKNSSSDVSREVSCESVIPDDEEERMAAELRILELSLGRHRDGIRAAADKGMAYPDDAMDDMMGVQRKLTDLKRKIKTARSSAVTAEAGPGAKEDEGHPRQSSGQLALEKVYGELLLEHDELVAIRAVLKDELAKETARVEECEAMVEADAVTAPGPDLGLAAIDDPLKLQSMVDAEVFTMDLLEEERGQLVESIVKERMACAALNVQIRQFDGASKVWDYRLDPKDSASKRTAFT